MTSSLMVFPPSGILDDVKCVDVSARSKVDFAFVLTVMVVVKRPPILLVGGLLFKELKVGVVVRFISGLTFVVFVEGLAVSTSWVDL